MKQNVIKVILFLTIIEVLSACGKQYTNENRTDDSTAILLENTEKPEYREIDLKLDISMPQPGNDNIGGDMLFNFYQPCKFKLDSIPGDLISMIGEEKYDEWRKCYGGVEIASSQLSDYLNLYSVIKHFDLSKEQVVPVLQDYMGEDSSDDTVILQEDLDILFSDNEEEIVQYFASDYSIVIGKYIYSPQWIYFHTAEDYRAVGISEEMLREKIDEYSKIPLAYDARSAFEEKLGQFLGEEIVFDTTYINEFWGGLYYEFEGHTINIGTETFDVEWLSQHTIQEYQDKGITADMLEQFLMQISECSDTKEYDWINSCLIRMKECE